MSRTYAIGDVHGRHDCLYQALLMISDLEEETAFQIKNYKVVILGDMIDRGPQSAHVIALLRFLQAEAPEKFIILRGNHEDIAIESIRNKLSLDWWIGNGGGQTLFSYGYENNDKLHPLRGKLDEDLDWLSSLPYTYEDEHRVYVHADLISDMPIKEHTPEYMSWNRVPKFANHGWMGKHVVHGHMQYEDGPILTQNRTNMDTFAWRTGRLGVGVFDDDRAGGPINILESKV